MAYFDVFWDRDAGVALVACNLGDLGLEHGLIAAERSDAHGQSDLCGLFEVKQGARKLSEVIAISVPASDAAATQLRLEVFGHDPMTNEAVRHAEQLSLLRENAGTALLPQATKWCVAGQTPAIEIMEGFETAPSDHISAVYVSPRDGANVYPAVAGETEGEGGVIAVSASFVEAVEMHTPEGSTEAIPNPDMLRVAVKAEDCDVDVNVSCYTLSASAHVLRLLQEGDDMRLDRTDNACAGKLRGRSGSELTFVSGRDHPDSWPEYASNTGASKTLDMLDRLVIETQPPTTIVHRDKMGTPQKVGKKGVAVLALGPGPLWHADDGDLLDRVLREERSFSEMPEQTFASEMGLAGLSVTAADMACASEIVVFAYAELQKRMTTRLGAMARSVSPQSCAGFCARAEDYTAISLLDAERINRRSLLNVGRALQAPEPGEAIRHLALGMLQDRRRDRKGLSETWARSSKVSGWAVYAALVDDTLFNAAAAGLTMDTVAVAMLLGDHDNPLSGDFRTMARTVDVLLEAGVLSRDDPKALEDFAMFDDRTARLEGLRKAAIGAVTTLNRQFGPFELMPSTDAFLAQLGEIDPSDDSGFGPADRIAAFFSEQAAKALDGEPGDAPGPVFADKLGKLLRQAVDKDARQVEQLVRLGLKDPIVLAADNVVPMGMGEMAVEGFVSQTIDDGLVQWMSSTAPGPSVVNHWRTVLKAAHDEKKQLRKTTGS